MPARRHAEHDATSPTAGDADDAQIVDGAVHDDLLLLSWRKMPRASVTAPGRAACPMYE